MLFATEGKDHEVWVRFIEALEKHHGHRHCVTQVSMDMSPAYQKRVKENCRNAQVVFDKFHVVMKANQAVDEVRRAEVRLAGIDQKSLRTAKAYQMRLVLQDIYRSPTATVARQRFRVWCRWAARQQPKNLLRSMVKVADLVEKHLAGILVHWKWGLTNAFMEGLNICLHRDQTQGARLPFHDAPHHHALLQCRQAPPASILIPPKTAGTNEIERAR